MVSKNEHTGQKQQTKVPSQQYKDNYDLIFGKKSIAEQVIIEDIQDGFYGTDR